MRQQFLVWALIALAPCGRLSAQEEPDDPARRFVEFERAWSDHVEKWRQEQRAAVEKAAESGGFMPAMRMAPELGTFRQRCIDEAKACKGKDGAVPFWTWLTRAGAAAGDDEAILVAVDALMSAHVESKGLGDFVTTLGGLGGILGPDVVREHLAAIESKNPAPDVQARAILARVTPALTRARLESPEYATARAEALRAQKLTPDEQLKVRIQGMIDERERLAVGAVAPEIEGIDLDGVSFKLSDYKGKVILLDFWGNW